MYLWLISDSGLYFFLQQSACFPEIEADTFLDWNSQAFGAASTDQAPSAGDAASDSDSALRSSHKDDSHYQQTPDSLMWESAGLMPRLKLPVLVNPDQPSSLGNSMAPSMPPDMPNGPSIATARVKHPLSSIESAALTQLRAELNALFAEAHKGPDLSLVPLPKQLNQATVAKGAQAVKLAKPNRLQPRAGAAVLRSKARRRYTADAALPQSLHSRQSNSAESAQLQSELRQQGMTHPAVAQQARMQQAESAAADAAATAAATAHAPGDVSTAGTSQSTPKGKKYGRSSSWAAGTSPTRTGVTQNSAASTSYSKCVLCYHCRGRSVHLQVTASALSVLNAE